MNLYFGHPISALAGWKRNFSARSLLVQVAAATLMAFAVSVRLPAASTAPITPKNVITLLVWDPTGVPTEFSRGRIDWQHRDLGWKDVLGFRGAKDVEKPVGEWNLIEAYCREGDVDYYLNGVKVHEGRNGTYKHGKLRFPSEGAEIYFRKIELHPLK